MKKKEPILVYRAGRISNQKVRRHFIEWRQNQNPPISMRCDNSICCFHTLPCVWNGSELKLILDHKKVYVAITDQRTYNFYVQIVILSNQPMEVQTKERLNRVVADFQ